MGEGADRFLVHVKRVRMGEHHRQRIDPRFSRVEKRRSERGEVGAALDNNSLAGDRAVGLGVVVVVRGSVSQGY